MDLGEKEPRRSPGLEEVEIVMGEGLEQAGVPVETGEGSSQPQELKSSNIQLLIRNANPVRGKDLILDLDERVTLRELKSRIQNEHGSKPPPHEQVLIHAGKLLKEDSVTVGEVVRKGTHDQAGPFSFHLVIQGKNGGASQAPKPEVPSRPVGVPAGTNARMGGGAVNPNIMQGAGTVAGGRTPLGPQPVQQGVRLPSNMTMVPQGAAVALPYMVVNPVVSAAYGAAFAAVNNGVPTQVQASNPAQLPTMPYMSPSWCIPGQVPQTTPATSGSDVPQQQQPQPVLGPGPTGFPPLIPAIAFFPLGVPIEVPANAAPQGFQVYPQMAPHIPNADTNMYQGPVPVNPQRLHHPAPGAQAPRRRRRRVVMYRISIRSLLQVIIFISLLYAYTPRGRFALLAGILCALFLIAKPLRRILGNLTRNGNLRRGQNPQPTGFVQTVLTLVFGFVSSVFPAWNVNPQDEAAFAAAQELVNREDNEMEIIENQLDDLDQNEVPENGHLHQD